MKRFGVFLLVLLFGCDKYEEVICDHYYLAEVNDGQGTVSKLKYASQLLSSLTITEPNGTVSGYSFSYSNNRLVEVEGVEFFMRIGFVYDNEGRLIASLKYNDSDDVTDSIAMEYDAEDRIVRRSLYKVAPGYVDLNSYSEAEYIGGNTSKMDFYSKDEFTGNILWQSTFTFTYDNKNKPYPPEYYLFTIALGNAITANNELSLDGTYADGGTYSTTYKYSYNGGGYPIRIINNGAYIDYKYACAPPY